MCGIVGYIRTGDQEQLRSSTRLLDHRGPDTWGTHWFDTLGSGLGHTRLSIMDLSEKGNQPMYDPGSKNWIVFNGEIYNYQDIRKRLKGMGDSFVSDTDTEVLLKAYARWGAACLEQLNGMFAFAIFNEISGKLFIARDRQGIKPLYYYLKEDQIIFASEIKAIFGSDGYSPAPDMQALYTPVHYQAGPYTGFTDILKLPAASYLELETGQVAQIKKYWQLEVTENETDEHKALEELDALLNDAVSLNLVSDRPVGIMLSGGLDSSLLAALMQKKKSDALTSFTIKFSQADLKRQGNVDDSYYAKKMADEFGFDHSEITIQPDVVDLLPKLIYHLDEPVADPAMINTYLISKAAKERGISVLLTGMGADEVFGGYRSYQACIKADTYQRFIPGFLRPSVQRMVAQLPENNSKRNFKYIRWIKRFIEIASLNQFERQLFVKNSTLNQEAFQQYFVDAPTVEKSHYYQLSKNQFDTNPDASYITKMCYSDTLNYMCDHNLNYCDKSMMAASVEGRPTLIDHRLIEFMFRQTPAHRIKNNEQKYLLKKASEKYIPKEIIYRPKAPFSAPMRGWLKNELREMVRDVLSFQSLKDRGIYNPKYVQQLIERNENGIEDNSQLIWRLMVNETWFRTFFK
ncbi:MAG: asparagine synthase (glutamine-hydrolyzing) [Roseivirga sp.]|nr:asparagine synthase (glutamine-hydrolyzing) [Roseivirga sp.]